MYRQTTHDHTIHLLRTQILSYLKRQPIAVLRQAPFSMCINGSLYGPDMQIIHIGNPYYTPRGMTGPPEIVIEVVSEKSSKRDHGAKIDLYESAGVAEYWIVDVRRREVRFFQRDAEGDYIAHYPDYTRRYRTPLLPDFGLYVPMLWDLAQFQRKTAELNNAAAPLKLQTTELDNDPAPQKSRSTVSQR